MDFNPDDVSQYLDGVNFPANKADLLTAAQTNNAPESLVGGLQDLPESEFSGPEQVVGALRGLPGGG